MKEKKYLKKGLIPHINNKEHYINPNVLAGLGGGFLVTRDQQKLKPGQKYFNAENIVDKIFN